MVFDVDPNTGVVADPVSLQAPPHEPGLLPRRLREHGVDVVIAGGMGRRAQGLFAESGVQILVGALVDDPRALVEEYLSGALSTGDNPCDH